MSVKVKPINGWQCSNGEIFETEDDAISQEAKIELMSLTGKLPFGDLSVQWWVDHLNDLERIVYLIQHI